MNREQERQWIEQQRQGILSAAGAADAVRVALQIIDELTLEAWDSTARPDVLGNHALLSGAVMQMHGYEELKGRINDYVAAGTGVRKAEEAADREEA